MYVHHSNLREVRMVFENEAQNVAPIATTEQVRSY